MSLSLTIKIPPLSVTQGVNGLRREIQMSRTPMRLAIWSVICGMAIMLGPAGLAQVRDEVRPFNSRFREYLETYAKATLPRSAEYSVAVIGLVNKANTV